MKAIILSAGKSTRFAKEGWTIPKHLLPMSDGRRLIEWQEARMFWITPNVTTVLRKEHVDASRQYIRGKIATVADSSGILNTFLQVAYLALTREPIIITYNDSFLRLDEYKILAEMSPWLEVVSVVFPSREKRFNYPVKGFADGGIFKFKSGWTILRAMTKFPPPYTDKMGFYLLAKQLRARTYYTSSTHADLGTPKDYVSYMSNHGQKVEIQ